MTFNNIFLVIFFIGFVINTIDFLYFESPGRGLTLLRLISVFVLAFLTTPIAIPMYVICLAHSIVLKKATNPQE